MDNNQSSASLSPKKDKNIWPAILLILAGYMLFNYLFFHKLLSGYEAGLVIAAAPIFVSKVVRSALLERFKRNKIKFILLWVLLPLSIYFLLVGIGFLAESSQTAGRIIGGFGILFFVLFVFFILIGYGLLNLSEKIYSAYINFLKKIGLKDSDIVQGRSVQGWLIQFQPVGYQLWVYTAAGGRHKIMGFLALITAIIPIVIFVSVGTSERNNPQVSNKPQQQVQQPSPSPSDESKAPLFRKDIYRSVNFQDDGVKIKAMTDLPTKSPDGKEIENFILSQNNLNYIVFDTFVKERGAGKQYDYWILNRETKEIINLSKELVSSVNYINKFKENTKLDRYSLFPVFRGWIDDNPVFEIADGWSIIDSFWIYDPKANNFYYRPLAN